MLKDDVEQAKREGLIGSVIQDGACRFCGQLKKVETMIGWTDDQCDELATETCGCFDSCTYARKKGQKERAEKKINRLFVETLDNEPLDQAAVDLIREAAELVSDFKIKSCTIDNGNGCKAKVSITAKGNIKVERTDTEKQAEEA
jgi:hypothetical protein